MQMDAVSLLSGEQGETTKAQRYPLIICDSLHAAWMNMAHVWMNYIYIYMPNYMPIIIISKSCLNRDV